jgi:hypothetical protein
MSPLEVLCVSAAGGVLGQLLIDPVRWLTVGIPRGVWLRLRARWKGNPTARRSHSWRRRFDADAAGSEMPAGSLVGASVAEALAEDLGLHADARREQVSQYADKLANGDEVLRARLRQFEQPEPGDTSRPGSTWRRWLA